jgi:hypothetical protein
LSPGLPGCALLRRQRRRRWFSNDRCQVRENVVVFPVYDKNVATVEKENREKFSIFYHLRWWWQLAELRHRQRFAAAILNDPRTATKTTKATKANGEILPFSLFPVTLCRICR